MKFDRGIIKWQPFESVNSSKETIQSLLLEKSKIPKPILSEEEIKDLEEKIINCYYSKELVKIAYYQDGFIKNIQGKIIKIDHITKMIYLNNQHKVYFNQILNILI